MNNHDERREDVTFSDPVEWPVAPPAEQRSPGSGRGADGDYDLPPLPKLEPLPSLRPMSPMPRPPWEGESDAPGASPARPAPPPPIGHPDAWARPPADDAQRGSEGAPPPSPMTTSAPSAAPYVVEPPAQSGPSTNGSTAAQMGEPHERASWPESPGPTTARAAGFYPATPAVRPTPAGDRSAGAASPAVARVIENRFGPDAAADTAAERSAAAPSHPAGAGGAGGAGGAVQATGRRGAVEVPRASAAAATHGASRGIGDGNAPSAVEPFAGRHSVAESGGAEAASPGARGRRVLMIGGAEPLGGMVAERLIAAGHRLATHDVTLPANSPVLAEIASATVRVAEPISLPGDRSDTDEVVHTVARAEVALGGLDAIVILPAKRSSVTTLDADVTTWADEWSAALTTEVLAAACAAHIAARSFMARRRAGRIILVANGSGNASAGAMPTSATRAAIGRLGEDLARELGPRGIGVSVVTTGTGGAQDFAMMQVADVVEALLSTPVLSGVNSRIG